MADGKGLDGVLFVDVELVVDIMRTLIWGFGGVCSLMWL